MICGQGALALLDKGSLALSFRPRGSVSSALSSPTRLLCFKGFSGLFNKELAKHAEICYVYFTMLIKNIDVAGG